MPIPPTSQPLAVHMHGHDLVLHAERALELPEARTLIVADLHWGKATALRAHGVPVPTGGTAHDLARLDRVLTRTQARHLIVLGDLVHSQHAWTPSALTPLLAWRARWPDLIMTLVRGNHDTKAGDPPSALAIRTMDAPCRLAGLMCAHEPRVPAEGDPMHVWGHLHPTVRLTGRARAAVRLPCFVCGPRHIMLPAFSSFTGRGAWHARRDEQVYAIADQDIVRLG